MSKMRTFLLIALLTILLFNIGSDNLTQQGPSQKLVIIDTIEFRIQSETLDPIVITSNADFEAQGWPGNGSATNPYIIEDL